MSTTLVKSTNDNYQWMMTQQDKLFWAIRNNNFWMVHVLLGREVDLTVTNEEGLTLVGYAAQLGHMKMVKYLESKGAVK